jgi:hypothetical protein
LGQHHAKSIINNRTNWGGWNYWHDQSHIWRIKEKKITF